MSRAVISLVDPANAPEDVRKAAEAHLAKGYRMTNEKRTLLHNAVAFEALEGMSYAVSAEMKKFTGHRAANLFQYAISLENDCLVCSTYYRKAMGRSIRQSSAPWERGTRRIRQRSEWRISIRRLSVRWPGSSEASAANGESDI